jgi:hypothetical protein
VLALGFILSLAIGVSLGLLGGGGSILTVPVLHYVFGIGAHDSIATSLIVVGTTSIVAMVPHARAGRVRWKLGLAFGAASMAAAFGGGRIGAMLPGPVLIAGFAVVMLVAGGVMLLRARDTMSACNPVDVSLPRVLAIGLAVGLLTGTLGAGGGFVIVPALTLLGGLAMREAVGTSLLVIAMNSIAGFAGTATHASLAPRITLAVTGTAVVGSAAGVLLGKRMSSQLLQRAFGWFVIVVGVFILIRELG